MIFFVHYLAEVVVIAFLFQVIMQNTSGCRITRKNIEAQLKEINQRVLKT